MAFGWLGGAGIAFAANAFFLEFCRPQRLSGARLLGWSRNLLNGACHASGRTGTCQLISRTALVSLPGLPERPLIRWQITLSILFAAGCYVLLVGLEQGVSTYYNEYLWQWKPETIALFSLASFFAVICAVAMAPIVRVGGRRNASRSAFPVHGTDRPPPGRFAFARTQPEFPCLRGMAPICSGGCCWCMDRPWPLWAHWDSFSSVP